MFCSSLIGRSAYIVVSGKGFHSLPLALTITLTITIWLRGTFSSAASIYSTRFLPVGTINFGACPQLGCGSKTRAGSISLNCACSLECCVVCAVPYLAKGQGATAPPPRELEVINSALTDRAYRWLLILFAIVSNVPQRRSLRVYVKEIKKIR